MCCPKLSPHPSLRPARQRPTRRQHCARPQVARHACPSQAIRAHQLHRARRAARATASLPMLRRSDDRHRKLRAWLRAKEPREPNAPNDQDRHLMRAIAPPDHRATVRPTRWSSTGVGGARSINANYALSSGRLWSVEPRRAASQTQIGSIDPTRQLPSSSQKTSIGTLPALLSP
jgi:hypothetical protein